LVLSVISRDTIRLCKKRDECWSKLAALGLVAE
jgi:hypothetical protein